jgi:UDP-2,4-diacetamido-2,4,6-trideoxy-beta-L-altropyranose hydrolase
MKVLIRVDSSEKIGSGHVTRCLALAESLRELGAVVLFLSQELPGHVLELVRRSGFAVQPLSSHAEAANEGESWFSGSAWQADAGACAAMAGAVDGGVDWLIVDHYGIDSRWEEVLRPHVKQIAVIDDLANRAHDCDLLIDTNLQEGGIERYGALVPSHCVRLQGPKYALLRREFARERADLRQRDGRVMRVLVSFGGMDGSNQTGKALEAIASLERLELWTDVVVGATNPHRDVVREFCEAHPRFQFHDQTDKMAKLMAAADLGIGAGGSTTWERCAMGLPSLVLTVADNQVATTQAMSVAGRLLYLGAQHEVSAAMIAKVISGLIEMPRWLEFLGRRSAEVVDARGTERVAHRLFKPAIHLRPARPEDCRSVYDWRNDEQTRGFSHDSSRILLEDHERWFGRALTDSKRILLIGESEGNAVGILRYDLEETAALVSINLAPAWRGHGLGTQLLSSGSEWLRRNYPAIREIRAEIISGNTA